MKLSGSTCLITGANSGLGFAVAKQLAHRDANSILVCRDQDKGEQAISEIRKEKSEASLRLMICDLSSFDSVYKLIREIKGNYSHLDLLYNNAAVMKQKRTITQDGFEMMFQVNYLSAYVLMNSLMPLLKKSPNPMIINNGRPSHKLRLDMDDLQFAREYHMYNSFFKTKLCLLFASLELSKKPENKGITTTMIDPGPFKSKLVRDVPLAGWVKNLFSAPVEKAAENILYHLRENDTLDRNGKVFKEKQEWPLSDYWKDIEIGKGLMTATESLLTEFTMD